MVQCGATNKNYRQCGSKAQKGVDVCKRHLTQIFDDFNSFMVKPVSWSVLDEAGCDPRFREDINADLVTDYMDTLSEEEQNVLYHDAGNIVGPMMAEAFFRQLNALGVAHPLTATNLWDATVGRAPPVDFTTRVSEIEVLRYEMVMSRFNQALPTHGLGPGPHYITYSQIVGTGLPTVPAGRTPFPTEAEFDALQQKCIAHRIALDAYREKASVQRRAFQKEAAEKLDAWADKNPGPKQLPLLS